MEKRAHTKRYHLMKHPPVHYPYEYALESVKRMRVRVYDIEEAEALMSDMMARGYEGVQNDSYRYCRESAEYALKGGRCYICNGCYHIIVAKSQCRWAMKYQDVSKSKFIDEIDKSLKHTTL